MIDSWLSFDLPRIDNHLYKGCIKQIQPEHWQPTASLSFTLPNLIFSTIVTYSTLRANKSSSHQCGYFWLQLNAETTKHVWSDHIRHVCVCVAGPLKITALNVNCCATRPSLPDITSNMASASSWLLYLTMGLGDSDQISMDQPRSAQCSRDQLIVCWLDKMSISYKLHLYAPSV